jgi:hypothetical protein
MRASDALVAYQAGVGIVGFARLATDGYSIGSSEVADAFKIAARGAFMLAEPIPLSAVRGLPDAARDFGFVRCSRATIHWVSPRGRRRLALLAGAFDPRIVEKCRRWAEGTPR